MQTALACAHTRYYTIYCHLTIELKSHLHDLIQEKNKSNKKFWQRIRFRRRSTSLPSRVGLRALSPAPAMRVLAVVLITTWPGLAESASSLTNIANCAFTLGPSKCFSALTSWRAEKALANPDIQTKLTEDLKFPWIKYSNRSDEELHSQLCVETERLLRRKPLSLAVPGYRFEVLSRSNGSLNVDVYNTGMLLQSLNRLMGVKVA